MPKVKKSDDSSESSKSPRRPRAQQERIGRSEENIERVRKSVLNDPTASIRRRAQELGLTYNTIQRILTIDLKLSVQKKVEKNDDGSVKEEPIKEET